MMEPDKRYFGLKAGQLLACAPRPIKQWTAAAPELWFLVKIQASSGATRDPIPQTRNHGARLSTKPPQAACAHQAWNTNKIFTNREFTNQEFTNHIQDTISHKKSDLVLMYPHLSTC